MTEPRNPAPPDDSAFGVQRIKAGHGGGAVRLATLVRDLIERHQMARADAVLSHLLPPLSEPNAPALHLLQPGGNAQPLGEREWFTTGSGNQELGRGVRSGGIAGGGFNRALVGRSLGRGLVGAVAWLRVVWGDATFTDAASLDNLQAAAAYLAVSEADAVAVWGWGSAAVHADDAAPVSLFPLADFDALVTYRKAQKAANVAAGKPDKTIPWTDGNQLDLLRGEYARLGEHPGAAVPIAKALGTTRQAVVAALEKERKRKAPSPLPSLGTSRAA
jgi:hypothetical protein